MTASVCDKCGETADDIDAGFSPGLHGMSHDCGGIWRIRGRAALTIDQALARSTSHTEIVACIGTREEIDGLCAEADGSADLVSQYGYVDVWGTDDDGGEYRLHITPEEPEADPSPLCRCGMCAPGNVTCVSTD